MLPLVAVSVPKFPLVPKTFIPKTEVVVALPRLETVDERLVE